ncbi:hypothetical protein BGX26_010713 [Mortierella sp. AD094]|nr:hypothetical protein BGX26_010713 [Mortierella sp. AD094]
MSTSTSQPTTWTVFTEVLAKWCEQCSPGQDSHSHSRIRKISDFDNSQLPAPKRRILEDGVLVIEVDTDQKDEPIDTAKRIAPSRNIQDWILARQWLETLGPASFDLPCHHILDLNALPSLAVKYQDGAIMTMLCDEILAMRQDVPENLSWSKLTSRTAPRSSTLFTAVFALQYTRQVVLEATLVRASDLSLLQINFKILLHQSLLSESLLFKGTIDTQMQDLLYFVFPPPTEPSRPFTANAIKDLYSYLKPTNSTEPPPGIQPAHLIPQLLPFQKRSVAWCLKRECGIVNDAGEVEYIEPSFSEKLPLTWERISTPSGASLLVNRLCGLLCLENTDLVVDQPEPRGGILAEEMGLGKTVEMLALILLNRRKLENRVEPDRRSDTSSLEEQLSAAHLGEIDQSASMVTTTDNQFTPSSKTPLIKSAATLIITPPSIVDQWASEIENHAPTLRVFMYTEGSHESITTQQLAQYDVVLTTYHILSKEVRYTNHYDRPRRYERQHVPRTSHFIAIDWWRVCLDEAQMIEGSSVSQAAAMALMVPRVMSWAISGTPIRSNIEDLHSLLKFLNQEPIASNKRLWRLLTTFNFRSTFISSYRRIMHRYAKRDVAQELALPPQLRITYGIHFTEIERANYNEKWEQCSADCDVDIVNDNNEEAERLQSWFMRLRQTCCHPQIGVRNRESLGKTNLRTIDEVLDVMVQQNTTQLYFKEKAKFVARVKRAVLIGRIHKNNSIMELFKKLVDEAAHHVDTWKAKYEEQVAKRTRERRLQQGNANEKGKEVKQDAPEDDEDRAAIEILGKVKPATDDAFGTALARHKEWLEQQHRILFFTAGFYHDLEMEEEETEYYNQAEGVRQNILAFLDQRFNRRLAAIKDNLVDVTLDVKHVIPASAFTGRIAMWRHLEQLEFVRTLLNRQLDILSRWRGDLVKRLTQPLMQDGEEGEQYQYSIDLQHTLESYLHFYGRMILFRKDLVSGTHDAIAQYVTNLENQREHAAMVKRRENRVRKFKRKANEEEEKREEDLDTRLEREMNELITPDLASTLRSIRASIKSVANDNLRPAEERKMAETEDLRLKDEQTRQVKMALDLEKEIFDFRALTATRTAYYRQLQAISDTVRDIESADPEEDIDNCVAEERKLETDIVRLISKRRYLEHLAATNQKEDQSEEERLCLICRSQYDLGLMTECGHVYCEHCLMEWTRNHSKCPSCNSLISRRRLTRVTMSGSVAAEPEADLTLASDTSESSSSSSAAPQSKVHHINNLRLVPETIRRMPIEDGYGSKIDSIARHISYLVREDPETKCLVFSQWNNLLQLLSESLTKNRIGFVKLAGASVKTAVKQFKENQDKHVFMLHAKSQSAGLTLLSATHIFICEPLVNPVLQAQAVSRVHRIGQTKTTFVHYYLINNTVEIPCFDLFERKQAAASGASTHHDTDEDNSKRFAESSSSACGTIKDGKDVELDSDIATTASEVAKAQNQEGELVKLEDLKYCFRVQKQMNLQIEA